MENKIPKKTRIHQKKSLNVSGTSLFNKNLLSTSFVLGTVLGAEETVTNKTN